MGDPSFQYASRKTALIPRSSNVPRQSRSRRSASSLPSIQSWLIPSFFPGELSFALDSTQIHQPDSSRLWIASFDAGRFPSHRSLSKSLYLLVMTSPSRTPVAGSRLNDSPLVRTYAIIACRQPGGTTDVARESFAVPPPVQPAS